MDSKALNRRFWIAGLVGAVVMYGWASFAHMNTALATAGFSRVQNEPTFLTELQNSLGKRPGLYAYPYMRPDDMGKADARLKTSPQGMVLYRPPGGKGLEVRQLIGEFGLELFETLLVTALLSLTTLQTMTGRIGFFAAAGALAAVVTNGSYWLFYGFPAAYSLAAMFVELMKFVCAGVAVALVLGRTPVPAYNDG